MISALEVGFRGTRTNAFKNWQNVSCSRILSGGIGNNQIAFVVCERLSLIFFANFAKSSRPLR